LDSLQQAENLITERKKNVFSNFSIRSCIRIKYGGQNAEASSLRPHDPWAYEYAYSDPVSDCLDGYCKFTKRNRNIKKKVIMIFTEIQILILKF
jgi:hypothetical protein